MTNQEIYDSALRLASEVQQSDANQDYKERAPYLIAAICYRYAPLDKLYRKANNLSEQKLLAINCFPFPTLFPLCEVFAPAVSSALAGLLVLEENPELSDRLMKLADDMIADLRSAFPFRKESIVSYYTL